MKYTIKQPEMMSAASPAKYNPNVIITILIAIVIYIAYAITNFIGGLVYAPFYLMQHPDFLQNPGQLTNVMTDLGSSPGFILMCFFLMGFLILFTIIEARFIEKRKLSTIGLTKKRFAVKYLKGFGVGALLIAILLIPSVITEWNNMKVNGFQSIALWFLLAFMVQTAAEEILFRGYLLTTFGRKIGMFWAVMLSSLLFALMHILNGDATILGIVSIFLIGTLLGFYMVRDNNIWGAFGIHAAWNFVQGLFSGVSVGIISMDYSVVSLGETPDPASFGVVGDPSSIICIVVMLAAIAVVLFAGKNRIVVTKIPIVMSGTLSENTEANPTTTGSGDTI